jgi:hypothetical protein
MADELKRIRPIWGEFADRDIDLPTADADQAIADGWAFDPHSEEPRELPPILTEEERQGMLDLSAAAMRKARGEPDPAPPEPEVDPPVTHRKSRALTSEEESGSYQTRGSSSKRAAKDE